MNCRSAESLYSAFIEDELTQEERRSLEAHLMGCRRCSVAVKELRATVALVATLPTFETNLHFDEDVMDRIRSGEALRPTLIEWLHDLLTPQRLRPVFMGGAAVCAIWIAAIVARPVDQSAPPGVVRNEASPHAVEAPVATVATAPTSTVPSPAAAPSVENPAQGPGSIAARPSGRRTEAREPAVDFQWADTEVPVASFISDSTLPNPGSRFQDEYILDQFYLDRASQGGTHSIVPVSGRASDDVYITF
jgi:anti-sigma factor RsiW